MEKVQTGIRIERGILKLLKALAAYLGIPMGDLLEGMVLYSFEGKSPFRPRVLKKIEQFKDVYGVPYGSGLSHRMPEDQYQRVQTGVRVEKTLLKVLKGLSAYLEMSLGDLVEGIVLYAFEGKAPFVPKTRAKIAQLKDIYELGYGSEGANPAVRG